MSTTEPRRLLIVSSRSRNKIPISASLLSNVIKLEYDYETSTLNDLVSLEHTKRKLFVKSETWNIIKNVIQSLEYYLHIL